MSNVGLLSKAWAIPNRCFIPRENPPIRRLTLDSPTRSKSSSHLSFITCFGSPVTSAHNNRYSRGVI